MGHDQDRQSTHTGGTILAAFFIFIVCAFASAVIAAYQRDKIEKLATFFRWLQRPSPAISLEHPVSPKQDRIEQRFINTERLLKPEILFRNAAFSQIETFAATDFCALLGPELPALKLTWQPNALFADTLDCTVEVAPRLQVRPRTRKTRSSFSSGETSSAHRHPCGSSWWRQTRRGAMN